MLLNSLNFIFAFLPLILIIYYVTPDRWKNVFLILASIYFYAWGEPVYVILMLFSVVLHYMMAIQIEREQESGKTGKATLVFVVVIDVAVLCFFKYFGFAADLFNEVLGTGFDGAALAFPLGLSFYTFRNLSYVVDIYQKKILAEKDFIDFAAYASLFATMGAGPIVRYAEVADELHERSVYMSRLGEGARRFILGLSKKVIVADQLAVIYREIHAADAELSFVSAWIALFAYTMQIYFDFSGYSDMAIGIGKMLGFDFKENFHYPYTAKSVTEFWRRWHISLSMWFRDYIYIPLGGNKKGVQRQILNIGIVWCLTGIWHGSTVNFLIWGLYFAVVLLLEKFVWKKWIEKIPGWAANLYTMFFVMLSWVIFANPSLIDCGAMFGALFGVGANGIIDATAAYFLKTGLLLFVLCVLATRPFLYKWMEKWLNKSVILTVAVYSILFLISIAGLVFHSYQPFLYMQF